MGKRGPKVTQLIALRMARMVMKDVRDIGEAINAINGLSEPGRMTRLHWDAAAWVRDAIAAVKAAPDNEFGDNDERIAGEILRRLEERKRERTPNGRSGANN